MHMLPAWFILVAVVIRLSAGYSYIRAVLNKKAHPNPITWFFWGLTPLIAFSAQISKDVGLAAWITLALAIGPLIIFILSLRHNWSRAHFTPSTTICAVMALLGIGLWLSTDNPAFAIVFSIMADIFGSIPTLVKTYHNPASEDARAYLLSVVSMVITLFTITNWSFASYAMPAYILLINLVIFITTQHRRLFPALAPVPVSVDTRSRKQRSSKRSRTA